MKLAERLRGYGLYLRGATRLAAEEMNTYGFAAERPEVALVGNIGSSYWKVFSGSNEYRDGTADPLDRWSRRVAESIATEFALQPVYPFDGPPYYPFQQWARRAEGLSQSPLGITIHPRHGLWHSYRFALLGANFEIEAAEADESPCLSCAQRPCLRTCPVEAFSAAGYDDARCAAYLRESPDAECHQCGCLARLACPVAPQLRYLPEQGAFHLQAFLDNRP